MSRSSPQVLATHSSKSTTDFSVVGAYPPGARMQITQPTPENHAHALRTIPEVGLPDSDPLSGKDGPLVKLWGNGNGVTR